MRSTHLARAIIIGLLAFATCGAAVAGTASTSFQANATVVQACVASANNLNFAAVGTTSVTSGYVAQNAQTTILLTCNAAFPVSVELQAGTMTISGQSVVYNLFQDAAHTLPWGTLAAAQAKNVTASTGQQALTVYGQIPVQPNIPAGTGSAAVVINLSY